MNRCTEIQHPTQSKALLSTYEKKPCIGSAATTSRFVLPQLGTSENTNEFRSLARPGGGDIRKARHELNVARGRRLQKDNDFTAVGEEQDPTNRFVMRKLQKCGYDLDQMAQKYQGSKQKWIDPDFSYEQLKIGQFKAEWLRPEEFIDKPDLFPEEIDPNDVIQGWLNNCYFLSALSCLAEKPHRIYSLFETKQYNPNGYYVCKMTFNGIYQEVIVDDRFPVIPRRKPIYAKPAQGRYIWPMILEKCWAKLLRSYSNTNYGYTSEAFSALTGAPTKFHLLRSFRTFEDPQCLKLFGLLKQSDEKGYVTEVSIGRYDSPQQQKMWIDKYGLPTGHAYSLLGVYQTILKNGNKVKLLQIRNPWGDKQSKLIWNDKDPQWELVYPSEKVRMQYILNNHASDGVFYMDWETFVVKFDYMFSICEINDSSNYTYTNLEMSQRGVRYLEMQTDGSPEDLAISFVQEMQLHFKEVVSYAQISVIASKIGQNADKQTVYEFYGAGSYYSQEIDNYFTFPRKKFTKGRYLFRVFATWPEQTQEKIPLVVGLYSPAVVGLRQRLDIDDQAFLELNCLSLARKSRNRQPIARDQQSWSCTDMIPETNMGYFAFSHGKNSTIKDYTIRFDEGSNQSIYFMFQYGGRRAFMINSERGYEYIVLYAFVMSNALIFQKVFMPGTALRLRMPQFRLVTK